jgi:hypothetical protein
MMPAGAYVLAAAAIATTSSTMAHSYQRLLAPALLRRTKKRWSRPVLRWG